MSSVYKSSARLRALPVSVSERFDFTPPEVQVCLGLLQGKSLYEIAEEHSFKRKDLQDQYQSLLKKTGTNTEAKLVTVLLSSTMAATG